MTRILIVLALLCAAPAWADTPTVFSRSGSTLRIIGGQRPDFPGSAIYNFATADVEIVNGVQIEHKLFQLIDFGNLGNSVAGPGCALSADFQEGNYIECPADGVRTIEITLPTNAEDDFLFLTAADPVTGAYYMQYPDVTTIKIKSNGTANYLGLGAATPIDVYPMFPNLTNLQVKTKHPFIGR